MTSNLATVGPDDVFRGGTGYSTQSKPRCSVASPLKSVGSAAGAITLIADASSGLRADGQLSAVRTRRCLEVAVEPHDIAGERDIGI